MDKKDYYFQQLVKAKRDARPAPSEYGSMIMPALELYKGLSRPEDRTGYRDALVKMLGGRDRELRRFAALVCLGFIVFEIALNTG